MLTQMRHLTRGWIAGGLVGLLVLAFAIWGINDVFSGMGSNGVAQVAGRDIGAAELSRELEFVIRQQNARLEQGQTPLSRGQVIEQGGHVQVLNGMISRRALEAFVARLGVHASPAQIADAIRRLPNAQNPITQTFDREAYDAFLREIGYRPSEFEREIGSGIALSEVMGSLAAGARAPASFGAIALAFESERRIVSFAELPLARLGAIPAPTDAQVQEAYTQMRAQFAVPEYRAVTLVLARASDFTARVEIAESAIREDFDSHRAQLTQPEKRSFVQITAPDQAKAQDAAARLARGEAPQAVAEAVGGTLVDYAEKARTEVPDPAIAEAAFAMAQGAAPQAVRGRLAPFAAIALTAITPAVTPVYENERERIRAELAEAEAGDLMNAAVEAFNDARAAGTDLAQAARANNLTVIDIPAVSSEGRAPDGSTPDALIDQAAVIEGISQTQEGEVSDFIAGADGADVIVQVNRITPATTRPLTEVRDDVVAFWTARERANRLRAAGARIVEAVAGGQSFTAAAAANGARVIDTDRELDRRMASQIPAQQLAALIFNARAGQVVTDLRADGEALIVAEVKEVRRTSPTEDPAALEQARLAYQQQLGQSIAQAVEADAERAANVQRGGRYERALNAAFPRETAPTEEEE